MIDVIDEITRCEWCGRSRVERCSTGDPSTPVARLLAAGSTFFIAKGAPEKGPRTSVRCLTCFRVTPIAPPETHAEIELAAIAALTHALKSNAPYVSATFIDGPRSPGDSRAQRLAVMLVSDSDAHYQCNDYERMINMLRDRSHLSYITPARFVRGLLSSALKNTRAGTSASRRETIAMIKRAIERLRHEESN